MITREDLKSFFNLSAQESEDKNNLLNELTLEQRVAERKAIKDLTLDPEYHEQSADGKIYLLHAVENLSDFKEGETVILCTQEHGRVLCECNIHEFRECGDIEIIVNQYNYTSDIDKSTNIKLYLQAKPAKMSDFYANFCGNSKFFDSKYFEEHLINKQPSPRITPIGDKERSDTAEFAKTSFNVNLNANQVEAFIHAEHAEDYFLIQGPPGSGKSFLSALIIVYLLVAEKKRFAIVGPTHMAVNNALIKVAEVLLQLLYPYSDDEACNIVKNSIFKIGQSYHAKNLYITTPKDEKIKICNITHADVFAFNILENPWVVGMTPYSLQSRRAKGLQFDVLFVDEAGQLTIPIAWMAMVEPKKIIFAGDHKQLPPIVSEKVEHLELKHSIFQHLCNDKNSIMLNVSFRMNGVICDLVSNLFYEGQLKPFNSEKRLKTNLTEPLYASAYPIVLYDSKHKGKQFSKEEAELIVTIISKYIASGIAPSDIAVLAPFRAQCALIRRMLASQDTIPAELRKEIVIDTVDRMQGQEREIIIYSFTSGDPSYMADKQDFLYNPNKLNVAFSRAKNKLILIANQASLRELSNPLVNQILDYPTIHKL
jgi:superfamily I DNA and/or RNA helicase